VAQSPPTRWDNGHAQLQPSPSLAAILLTEATSTCQTLPGLPSVSNKLLKCLCTPPTIAPLLPQAAVIPWPASLPVHTRVISSGHSHYFKGHWLSSGKRVKVMHSLLSHALFLQSSQEGLFSNTGAILRLHSLFSLVTSLLFTLSIIGCAMPLY